MPPVPAGRPVTVILPPETCTRGRPAPASSVVARPLARGNLSLKFIGRRPAMRTRSFPATPRVPRLASSFTGTRNTIFLSALTLSTRRPSSEAFGLGRCTTVKSSEQGRLVSWTRATRGLPFLGTTRTARVWRSARRSMSGPMRTAQGARRLTAMRRPPSL